MPTHGLSLEMTRVLPAPRARVFESVADAALLARWWGPAGFTVPRLDFDPRVGATYAIEMLPPDGEGFRLTGTFHEVDVPSQLAFSFTWDPPDPDDQETVARLSFLAMDDATEIRLRQGPFKTGARLALHRDGWTASLDKLRDLVAAEGHSGAGG